MANNTRIEIKEAAFEKKMQTLVSRAKDLRAYLNTVVVNQYIQAQTQRWQTENASEGAPWQPINQQYRQSKLRLFSRFPGGGRRTLIATNALVNAAIGRDTASFRKLVEARRLTIGIDPVSVRDKHYELLGTVLTGKKPRKKSFSSKSGTPYPYYVAEKRPFMAFGADTKSKIRIGIRNYLLKGQTL